MIEGAPVLLARIFSSINEVAESVGFAGDGPYLPVSNSYVQVLKSPPEIRNGYVEASRDPVLGAEVDAERLANNPACDFC